MMAKGWPKKDNKTKHDKIRVILGAMQNPEKVILPSCRTRLFVVNPEATQCFYTRGFEGVRRML